MIFPIEIIYSQNYHLNVLRAGGLLDDEEREIVLSAIEETAYPRLLDWPKIIAKSLLIPTSIEIEASPERVKRFCQSLNIAAYELALDLNKTIKSIREILVQESSVNDRAILTEIDLFIESFTTACWEVGHDFKINPFFELLMQWREEVYGVVTRQIDDPRPQLIKFAKEPSEKNITRMEWLGDQKKLAELFIALKRKGWIDNISIQAIIGCFTNTDAIEAYLRPANEKYEPTYAHVYGGKRYKRMFEEIKQNPKSKK